VVSIKMTSQWSPPADDFSIYYVLTECTDYYDTLPVKEADGNQPHFQGVTGLRNLGNTCYMNAIFWCLCSISPLVEYFLSGKYITTQQDGQEFLIYVLNELHEALEKVKILQESITTETSIITRLFEGQLSYCIVCLKCEKRTYKNEVFTLLSLPIPSEYECSLQDCLQCFFQQDTLTWNNQIHCSFCETKQETAVRASISKAPKIIVFHLKRFDSQSTMKRKLRTDIHYPLTNLDLTPYISPIFRKHPKYNFCAVVVSKKLLKVTQF
uniref:ubiquitinyl hydrolase 1 n=1 Tax=Saimiri boliviensis boliviensis TaxID=39432 RepID=A0A2K6SYM1_SAIBB